MKNVKIYTIESAQLSPPIVGEGFCVEMVRHNDYAALAERMKMIHELTKAVELLNEEARKSYEELQQQLAAVVAENENLVNFITCKHWCASDCMPETPVTDEFMAEVRAQVLEQFAAQQEAISKKYPTGSYGQESAYDAAQCARELAEQLRQGVAQ